MRPITERSPKQLSMQTPRTSLALTPLALTPLALAPFACLALVPLAACTGCSGPSTRTACGPRISAALERPLDLHLVGAVYSPDYPPARAILADIFDGLVFIRDTTASEPLGR